MIGRAEPIHILNDASDVIGSYVVIKTAGDDNPPMSIPLFEVHVLDTKNKKVGVFSAYGDSSKLKFTNDSGHINLKIIYSRDEADKMGGALAQVLLESQDKGVQEQVVAIQTELSKRARDGVGRIESYGSRGMGTPPS